MISSVLFRGVEVMCKLYKKGELSVRLWMTAWMKREGNCWLDIGSIMLRRRVRHKASGSEWCSPNLLYWSSSGVMRPTLAHTTSHGLRMSSIRSIMYGVYGHWISALQTASCDLQELSQIQLDINESTVWCRSGALTTIWPPVVTISDIWHPRSW